MGEPDRLEQSFAAAIDRDVTPEKTVMKRLIICTAVLGLAFTNSAQAKGCIKGAIVGGVAGHMAGHGKVGAAAGCAIGHHEAHKADAQKTGSQPASPPK
jgi:uncharacterized protein YcfJ